MFDSLINNLRERFGRVSIEIDATKEEDLVDQIKGQVENIVADFQAALPEIEKELNEELKTQAAERRAALKVTVFESWSDNRHGDRDVFRFDLKIILNDSNGLEIALDIPGPNSMSISISDTDRIPMTYVDQVARNIIRSNLNETMNDETPLDLYCTKAGSTFMVDTRDPLLDIKEGDRYVVYAVFDNSDHDLAPRPHLECEERQSAFPDSHTHIVGPQIS